MVVEVVVWQNRQAAESISLVGTPEYIWQTILHTFRDIEASPACKTDSIECKYLLNTTYLKYISG